MSPSEMSDFFDLSFNNITSNQAPGLNEFEKSCFLTKAQNEVVINHFIANSKGNNIQTGFDGNAKRQIDFSMLMRTIEGTAVTPSINIHHGSNVGYFMIPSNILLYVSEGLTVLRKGVSKLLAVFPISYKEYNKLMSKPFRRPLKNQAWRMITSGAFSSYTYNDYIEVSNLVVTAPNIVGGVTAQDIFSVINGCKLAIVQNVDEENVLKVGDSYLMEDGTLGSDINSALEVTILTSLSSYINIPVSTSSTVVEIIPGVKDTIENYVITYLVRPTPIILTDLEDGLTIDGKDTESACILDPIIHEEIVQRAVELAKIAWQGDIQATMAAGQRSE